MQRWSVEADLRSLPLDDLAALLKELPEEDARALACQDFRCYVALVKEALQVPDFTFSSPVEAMARQLQLVANGLLKRLMVSIMPQFGKTVTNALAFLTWMLLRNPHQIYAYATYSSTRAQYVGGKLLAIVRSPVYQWLAGNRFELDPSLQTKSIFQTTRGGGIMCIGRGEGLTGYTIAGIVLDDTLKGFAEADSPTVRQKLHEWYTGDVMTRIKYEPPTQPERWDWIIHIGTRWHIDDLIGFARREQADHDWKILDFPALLENGESFCPERKSTQSLLLTKASIPSAREWSALYMQNPVPVGGTVFEMSWFLRYTRTTLPARFDKFVQSWDTASKKGKFNDPSVCTTWGLLGNKAYLLHVLRKRMEIPELKKKVVSHASDWFLAARGYLGSDFEATTDLVIIEEKSSGTGLLQDLKAECSMPCPLLGHTPEGDKETRARFVSDLVEGGHVLLPQAAPWLVDFEIEVQSFPVVKHDDQVDSLVQFLAWLRTQMRRVAVAGRAGSPRATRALRD